MGKLQFNVFMPVQDGGLQPAKAENRGWNQPYLAEISGIGRVHISELENGRREAGLRILEMLAVSFGISLSELLRDL